MRWPPARFWGWVAAALALSAILHWKRSQGAVESGKQALMARQRAVLQELGPKWLPMRDKIETWTLALAKSAEPEIVEKSLLQVGDFRDKPGLYLRMRTGQAIDASSIRKGAKGSLKDAFTSCLLRAPNANPLAGAECKRTRDCPRGEMCNELDHCAPPAQPYNLRVAYRTMHVLSDEWTRDVQDASDELRLRLLSSSFDDLSQDDLPVAADIVARAQYFLVVLDEDPPGGAPQARPDAGAVEDALLAAEHFARVGLFRLSDGKPLLRIRREAAAGLLGGAAPSDADAAEARQRQANSCGLALAVRSALGDTRGLTTSP
jgi:hypothetical protein